MKTLKQEIILSDILVYSGGVLIFLGSLTLFIAALGIVVFNDIFMRMHAAAKPQWLGVFLIALGLVATHQSWYWAVVGALLVLFQTVSAPLGSHLLGRSAARASEFHPKTGV